MGLLSKYIKQRAASRSSTDARLPYSAPDPTQQPAPPDPPPSRQTHSFRFSTPQMPMADCEIVLRLGDVFDNIPAHLVRPGHHDRNQRLTLRLAELFDHIARGHAAVALSSIARECPEVFRTAISALEDMDIAIPLQKIIEQIGDFSADAHAANGSDAPEEMTEENVVEEAPEPPPAEPARETLRPLIASSAAEFVPPAEPAFEAPIESAPEPPELLADESIQEESELSEVVHFEATPEKIEPPEVLADETIPEASETPEGLDTEPIFEASEPSEAPAYESVPEASEPPEVFASEPVTAEIEVPEVPADEPISEASEPPEVVATEPAPEAGEPPKILAFESTPEAIEPLRILTHDPTPAAVEPPIVLAEEPTPAASEPPEVLAPELISELSKAPEVPVPAVFVLPPPFRPPAMVPPPSNISPETLMPPSELSGSAESTVAPPFAIPFDQPRLRSIFGRQETFDALAVASSVRHLDHILASHVSVCGEDYESGDPPDEMTIEEIRSLRGRLTSDGAPTEIIRETTKRGEKISLTLCATASTSVCVAHDVAELPESTRQKLRDVVAALLESR